MEKVFTPQPKLGKKEVFAEYVKTGLDIKFADIFYEKYLKEYILYSKFYNASDMALRNSKNGIKWYALYHQNGHCEEWCDMAYRYGCDGIERDFSLENVISCIGWVCEELEDYSSDLYDATKETELAKHFNYVEKAFEKDKVFMRFYVEYANEFGFDHRMLSTVSQQAASYDEAIQRGKSEDFAYFYATYNGYEPWRIAELRERLQKEGRDKYYILLYLNKYAEGLEKDGEGRKLPNAPAPWEEEVAAYMKGWEYANKEESGISDVNERQRFVDVYEKTFYEAKHPVNPAAILWDRFDDFVLDIALRRFHGEFVEVEPFDPDAIRELIKANRTPQERKSSEQQLRDDMLEMLYPNGQDDDD